MLSSLAKGALTVLVKFVTAMASEQLMKWLFFRVAEEIVKRTDTPHDNAFLEKLKEQYEQNERKGN
jgi:hypothetical protein